MGKPNFLFLFADDMRYDTIAALGNSQIITPNLDELVKHGTSFINTHIPGGSVPAVCMPSRAMLNTGRTLYRLQDAGSSVPENHHLLGETLKDAGYRTFGTGKWHNGHTSYARSFTDGGEIFFGGMYDHWKVPVYSYDDTGNYVKSMNDVMNPGHDNFLKSVRMDHVTWGKHSTDLFADLACDFLDNYTDEKPFYMYVAYMAPHDPRTMPKQFLDMYNVDEIEVPQNFAPQHPFDFGINIVRDEILEAYPREKKAIQKHMRDYYAMITHLDASIGRIIESLKKSGKYDDTIIIFAADNGLGIGQHGLMGKQSCYEHSIKVPFVISGPGIPKNETRDSFIYLLDIYPTLCDIAGIQIPDTVDGKSFKSLVSDKDAEIRDRVFFTFSDKVRGIKDQRYKLITYRFGKDEITQLFDLENDPYETANLANFKELQAVVQRLRSELVEYAASWGDMESEWGKRFWNKEFSIEPEIGGINDGIH